MVHVLASRTGLRTADPIHNKTTHFVKHTISHTWLLLVFRGKTLEEATEDILSVQLPAIHKQISEGNLRVDNIDVFCERGVFDLISTCRILQAGKEMGLNINFHGDELNPMKAAQVRIHRVMCQISLGLCP